MSDKYQSEDAPRERSTYSAFGDEYRGFDARDDESGGKGPLIVILAVGVVLVFGAVVWNAYRQGIRTNPDDAPIFAADDSPYKRRLDDQGQPRSSETNMRLFDSIDNNDRTTLAENTSEAPVTEVSATVSDGRPRDLRPNAAPTSSSTPAPAPTTSAPVRTSTPEPVATQEVAPPRPLPPVEPTTSAANTSRFDASGGYLVQVMALRDRPTAETAWAQLVEAHRDLLAGAVMDIQRADLGSRGIFYRLRVAAFSTRDGATELCNALQARNQSCIVVTR